MTRTRNRFQPQRYLYMRAMKTVETGIPVISTPAYGNAWECLEDYPQVLPHKKKFQATSFPMGIPARSSCTALRYELLGSHFAFVTMADIVLGDAKRSFEKTTRTLIARDKIFSLGQAIAIVKRGMQTQSTKRDNPYATNNFFFVEAEEDRPCVVAISLRSRASAPEIYTFDWSGGFPCGNYGNLFVPE